MGLFGFGDDHEDDEDKVPVITEPVDPNWVNTPTGGFYSFLELDPEEMGLENIGGVYVIWHAGVKPEWVYAGHGANLASEFHNAGNNKDITYYEKNGGLFVAWAPVKDMYRPGVVKFLEESFKTLVANPDAYTEKTRPVPVIPPAKRHKGPTPHS